MGGPAGLTTLLQKATLSLEELKAAARVSIAEKPDILTALPCQLPPPGSPPGLHTCSGWVVLLWVVPADMHPPSQP